MDTNNINNANSGTNAIPFSIAPDNSARIREVLTLVYDALKAKGYNPVSQIVGYLISEDPTYITTYNNARNMILKIDRYVLLQELIKNYINI